VVPGCFVGENRFDYQMIGGVDLMRSCARSEANERSLSFDSEREAILLEAPASAACSATVLLYTRHFF
jgi:hypothetical protein